MTPGEIILCGFFLANIIATVAVAFFVSKRLTKIDSSVHQVELQTNSMKDDLVKSTETAALIRGDARGRLNLKAEQEEDRKSQKPLT